MKQVEKEEIVLFLANFTRPVTYYADFARISGGVVPGLFLSYLLHWYCEDGDKEGWIHKSRSEWEKETGLSRRGQERSRKRLKEAKLIEEELRGLPAILHYRPNLEKIIELLTSNPDVDVDKPDYSKGANWLARNEKTSMAESAKLSMTASAGDNSAQNEETAPHRTPKFKTFRKRLSGAALKTFESIIDSDKLRKIVGSTLKDYCERSPETAIAAFKETVEKRNIDSFDYFSKVYLTLIEKRKPTAEIEKQLLEKFENIARRAIRDDCSLRNVASEKGIELLQNEATNLNISIEELEERVKTLVKKLPEE